MEDVKKLKVGFIGAGGTGKTSVLDILAADCSIPEEVCGSVVRNTFKRLGISNETAQHSMTNDELWYLQREILNDKFDQDNTNRYGLFDRTPIDHMAYCLYRCGSHIGDSEYNLVMQQVFSYTSQYDILFFFPIFDFAGINDGFRETGKAYQMAIQSLMLGLLTNWNVKYHRMANTLPIGRAQFVKQKMDAVREGIMI